MPNSVRFLVPAGDSGRRPVTAYLETENGVRVDLPFAPRELTVDGFAATFARLNRPGLAPLTVRNGVGTTGVSFTAILGHLDRDEPIGDTIAALRKVAAAGPRVRFSYSDVEAGWWRIDSLSIQIVDRNPLQQPTRANASFQLIADVSTGPVPIAPPAAGGGRGWRMHVWRRGDTWHKVARRYLGDGSRWPEITKANRIRNPRSIRPGRRLRIPPR